MFVNKKMRTLMLGLVVLVALALASCAAPSPSPTAEAIVSPTPLPEATAPEVMRVDEEGNTFVEPEPLATAVAQYPVGTLTEEEIDGLLYMREEEKLARDVYLTLYQQWDLQIFQNIARSEQTHTDAVKTLLGRYGLDDPAAGNDIGVFTNPDLQALYDQLVDLGSQSLADALRVGAAIEEIDILDLEERIAQTDKEDIQLVYENLMMGSRNHLRAFTSTLETQTGETYQPQYLSQEVYEAIVSQPVERGGRGGPNRP